MNNQIPEGMLEFNLEKALAGWPVCMRDGTNVRISFVDNHSDNNNESIYGWYYEDDQWESTTWYLDGSSLLSSENCLDLFLKKKTRTYYQNIYRNDEGIIYAGETIHTGQIDAEKAGKNTVDYVKTISFELGEPEEKPNCNDIGKGHGFGLSTGICIECGVQQKKTKTLWVAICKKPYEKDDYGTSCAYSDRHVIDKNLTSDNYWIKSVEVECE